MHYSPTLSPSEVVDRQLAAKAERKTQHDRRLAELQELEEQLRKARGEQGLDLASHTSSTSSSTVPPRMPGWGWWLRLHWRTHGPMLSALLCSFAAMTAAYALWQGKYFGEQEARQLENEISEARERVRKGQEGMEIEAQNVTKAIEAYKHCKSAIISAPAELLNDASSSSSSSGASGWFSFLYRSKPQPQSTGTLVSESASSPNSYSPSSSSTATPQPPRALQLASRTLHASREELMQLHQVEAKIKQIYT